MTIGTLLKIIFLIAFTIGLAYFIFAEPSDPAPFVSPPPLPPADGSCVRYMDILLCPPDNEPDPFRSPVQAPARPCGKRYGENWCD